MSRPPLVLVSPDIEAKGKEFGDLSISLSGNYQQALMSAGALPLAMAATRSREMIAECVRRCDGVLLTGGDDVNPALYANGLPARVRRTVEITPDGGERDHREHRVKAGGRQVAAVLFDRTVSSGAVSGATRGT